MSAPTDRALPLLDAAAARARGLVLVTAATLIFSSGGLIVRSLDSADSWTTVFWRSVFATLFLMVYITARERGRTLAVFLRMGRAGLLIGACFAVASIGMVIALGLTTVANTLLILSISPLLAAGIGRVVLGERPSPSSWLAMLAAFCGVALMVSDSAGRGAITGDLIALGIACALAIAIVTIRRHREVRMTPATCLATVVAAGIALPLATPFAVSGSDFSLLVFFGAGQLGLGLALFTAGARLAPAAEVALIGLLEPILGPLWVWLFVGEQPSEHALLGAGIVVGALIAHTLFERRRARAMPPSV